ELAVNFLRDEIERATDRLRLAERVRELREMTFQTRELFADVRFVGEKNHFLHEPIVVRRDLESRALDALVQRLPVFFDDARMKLMDFPQRLAHEFQPLDHVLREMFAFAFAHFDQVAQRVVERGFDVAPRVVDFQRFLRLSQYTGRAQHGLDANLATRIEFLLQIDHRAVVSARQRGIERGFWRRRRAVVKRDDDIETAARNVRIDHVAHTRLELGEFARETHRDIALLAVDGIELDAEFGAIERALAPAVAGHASHAWRLKMRVQITNRNRPANR